METKRCPRCNKLLRADAQSCSRCGVVIAAGKVARKRATGGTDDTPMPSQPTNPPASPHRAGHYSGLHPEDQPFQSSFFLRVQRPPTPVPPDGSENVLLELEDSLPVVEQEEAFWREPLPKQELEERAPGEQSRALADFSTLSPRRLTPLPEMPPPARPRQSSRRVQVVPFLVTASLLFFLLATGLLSFLFLSKSPAHSAGPQLLALPGELRVGDVLQLAGNGFHPQSAVTVTHDAQLAVLDAQGQAAKTMTDGQGAFQLHIPITTAWSIGVHILRATDAAGLGASTSLTIQAASAGPPRLQLGTAHLDLGADNPNTLTHKNITLTNAGGGQVVWKAQSNVGWLSLTPSSGTFAGNAVVVLTVNRANLPPQAYLGQVTFTQDQGATQTLYVSMTVNTTPASMILSTASLAFAGTPAQSPAGQTMVIQNSGGQPLDWTAGSATSNGIDWLSVTPASGRLNAGTSAVLTVNVNTIKMALGTYQGTLSFSYAGGPAQQVAVTLTVNPPPQAVMNIAPASLSFTTNQGFNPAPKSFTISNTGNGPLNWVIHEDAFGLAFLGVSPTNGSIPPGQSVNVTITPVPGSMNGTINSTLTILDSDPSTNVPGQQVKVTIAITDQPVITLDTNNLEFDHNSTTTNSSQLLIFSNTGSLPLHWTITESAPVPWLSLETTSGTLAADRSTYIQVSSTSSQMKPGTYTVTLTLKDTDAGSVVASQTVTVTLIVSG